MTYGTSFRKFQLDPARLGETQIDGAAPGSASNLSATGLEGGGWVFTWDADLGAGAHEVRGQIFSGVIIGDLANLPIDAPFVINTTATGGASVPSVAPFDSGFVVAWTSQGSDGSSEILGQYFGDRGLKVGSEFQVNTTSNRPQLAPQIIVTPNLETIVTWRDDAATDERLVGQRFDPNGMKIGGEFVAGTGPASGMV